MIANDDKKITIEWKKAASHNMNCECFQAVVAVYAKRLDAAANYRRGAATQKSCCCAAHVYKCISFPKKSIRDTVA
jgi:hypothetical protein